MKYFSSLLPAVAMLAAANPILDPEFEAVSRSTDLDTSPAIALRAATPLVASLGSSYSAGAGLQRSYGKVLADLLAQKAGLSTPYNNYFNYSQGGENVTAVPGRAKQLGGKAYAAVVITAGGNDLNYVSCLGTPSQAHCGKTINKDEYIRRYTAALNATRDNTATSTPIYVVTYTQALGSHITCSAGADLCNLTPAQAAVAKQLYTNVVDWTTDAYTYWRGNNTRTIKLITMRAFSADRHDVNSTVPWCNGWNKVAPNDGSGWHPTKAGAEFMGQAIYNDLNGLAVPPH